MLHATKKLLTQNAEENKINRPSTANGGGIWDLRMKTGLLGLDKKNCRV